MLYINLILNYVSSRTISQYSFVIVKLMSRSPGTNNILSEWYIIVFLREQQQIKYINLICKTNIFMYRFITNRLLNFNHNHLIWRTKSCESHAQFAWWSDHGMLRYHRFDDNYVGCPVHANLCTVDLKFSLYFVWASSY